MIGGGGDVSDTGLAQQRQCRTDETADGAYLMPYEQLINPDTMPSKPLHWPWKLVKQHLDQLEALGTSYVGRRLYLLFNPATGRTNGTTQNFFATMTIRPSRVLLHACILVLAKIFVKITPRTFGRDDLDDEIGCTFYSLRCDETQMIV